MILSTGCFNVPMMVLNEGHFILPFSGVIHSNISNVAFTTFCRYTSCAFADSWKSIYR